MIRMNVTDPTVQSTEPSTLNPAKSAAGEAVDALLSVYWGDTFDCDGLEDAIASLILTFLGTAVPLTVKRQIEEV